MEVGNRKTRRWHTALRVLFLSLVGVTVVFPFYILMIEALHPNLVTMPYPMELWPEQVSLENYRYLFANNPIGRWTTNSLIISIGTSLFQVLLCSMAAFGFGRTEFRGASFAVVADAAPGHPIQTRILPLFIIFSNLKMLNTFWGMAAVFLRRVRDLPADAVHASDPHGF